MSRLSFLLFFALVIYLTCASGTDPGILEVDREGGLLHYSPVSSHSHLAVSLSSKRHSSCGGPGTTLIKEGFDDSLSITFVGSSPYSIYPWTSRHWFVVIWDATLGWKQWRSMRGASRCTAAAFDNSEVQTSLALHANRRVCHRFASLSGNERCSQRRTTLQWSAV